MSKSPLRRNANAVRIIAGRWRGRKLIFSATPGLRPTPDRVRETLFNWLGQDLTGWRVLDAFAGSGALGLEAASRGAAEVVLLEREPALVRSLDSVRRRLAAAQVQVVRADAMAWMARGAPTARFDLVLLDPPYDADLTQRALALAAPLVVPAGFVYLEAGGPAPAPPPGFDTWRTLRAGAVHAHLFKRTAHAGSAADMATS